MFINGNLSFFRRQAFVYGSSTGFYSDSSSAAAAAQHQSNLFRGFDKTTVRREGISICLRMFINGNTSFLGGKPLSMVIQPAFIVTAPQLPSLHNIKVIYLGVLTKQPLEDREFQFFCVCSLMESLHFLGGKPLSMVVQPAFIVTAPQLPSLLLKPPLLHNTKVIY
jgi:hypothetical protein